MGYCCWGVVTLTDGILVVLTKIMDAGPIIIIPGGLVVLGAARVCIIGITVLLIFADVGIIAAVLFDCKAVISANIVWLIFVADWDI